MHELRAYFVQRYGASAAPAPDARKRERLWRRGPCRRPSRYASGCSAGAQRRVVDDERRLGRGVLRPGEAQRDGLPGVRRQVEGAQGEAGRGVGVGPGGQRMRVPEESSTAVVIVS